MRSLRAALLALALTSSLPTYAQTTDPNTQRAADAADREDRGEWGWLGLLGLAGLAGLKRRDRDDHVGRTASNVR
jgi:hypothetical protein